MAGSNPFRRNLEGGFANAADATNSTTVVPQSINDPPLKAPSQVPNGYPRKSSLSLEIEEGDSTSSDEQTADPFNPDSSVSDNDNGNDDGGGDDNLKSPKGSAALDDRLPEYFGSIPHSSYTDGSSARPPSKAPMAPTRHREQSEFGTEDNHMAQDISLSTTRATRQISVDNTSGTSPSGRTSRDKKPPPPPRSHHGKRISVTADTVQDLQPRPSQYNNRLSFHAFSPESLASLPTSGTPNATSVSQSPASDYFSMPLESQMATDSSESLQRSHSQHSHHKRPPTPPLSRRRSQMRRSKSTQSKSNGSRLNMFSLESERYDSSQPPSPGRSVKSVTSSLSQERKRISMPPTSSGELRSAVLPTGIVPDSLSPPPNSRPNPPGRRASSHGNIQPGSLSTIPPPPPPPRRLRDSNNTRSSDSVAAPQTVPTEQATLPQPSNAHDILADLSRLQKEVDDLRGHYESRKVSQ
ncbi:uncharacterized protein N7459_000703 [Penicillium hispanicum]|uniref:uncharacterized protein n=1 Tax=Penicillium hispanicum TaxID=1080232 RepID=UPI002541043C|nr:uncharacterized protein N7459_000703 [Penicillium hispanicum]KAJ5594495.1 hypothetical protein N7459_000703 [Penicillium hispanicum]